MELVVVVVVLVVVAAAAAAVVVVAAVGPPAPQPRTPQLTRGTPHSGVLRSGNEPITHT